MSVVPTLVGGGISLVASLCMFSLAQLIERRRRATERRQEGGANAFTGFWKIKSAAEMLVNLQLEIEQAFSTAEENGLEGAEPCQIVRGLVGAPIVLDFLEAKELMFLHKEKRSNLIAEADVIVHRARNIDASMRKYTELRESMQAFLENHADGVGDAIGSVGDFALSGKNARIAKLKVQSLNQILEQIRKLLERDAAEAKHVTEEYLDIAKKHFGANFPAFQFDWVEN
jgi:hypothetical protein